MLHVDVVRAIVRDAVGAVPGTLGELALHADPGVAVRVTGQDGERQIPELRLLKGDFTRKRLPGSWSTQFFPGGAASRACCREERGQGSCRSHTSLLRAVGRRVW